MKGVTRTMNQIKQYASYAFGAFGHDAFYATLSTYFPIFVTSVLFTSKSNSATMIGAVSAMLVVIRILEIAFDPMIGGVVDNTRTRWGKFKPWLLGGGLVSAVALMLIFTSLGGLADQNDLVYLIVFAVIFIVLDVFYSFKDIALWSMLPALSVDSNTRTKFGTIARFGSTLGAQGVIIVVMPLVYFFSQKLSGTTGNGQTRAGWLGFAAVIALISFLGACTAAFGTHEQKNLIRENTEKTRLRDVFKAIGENDQLMWLGLSYFMFALGYVITNSLLLYYFRYVIGQPKAYSIVGVITAILGIVSVISFPFLVNLIKRRGVYIGGICMMLVGYLLFLFAGTNVPLVLLAIAIFFFPYPSVFLAALMTITDSVEYGQWKNGTRNESVTLAVRPLIDKLAGAFANGIVMLAALQSGMTGNAKPSDITSGGLLQFKMFMFYIPIILIILAAVVYAKKISLSEKRHAQIVDDLEKKLRAAKAAGQVIGDQDTPQTTPAQAKLTTTSGLKTDH